MTRTLPTDFRLQPVDTVAVDSRVAALATRSIKRDAKREGLHMVVAMTDLTTLEGRDSPGKVRSLCAKAMRPLPGRDDVPSVAAVCVYPDLVATAVAALGNSGVAVASVATAFPSGRAPLAVKLEDTRRAVGDGASEIDMVIDRGAFLRRDFGLVFDEICATKEVCGAAHLKVILETGELATYDNIKHASRLAILAGADFIKTSTGKIAPAATRPVVLLMLEAVRDHYLQTGQVVGVKAAGGIRTAKDALRYLVLLHETVGDTWWGPNAFRFGASSLLNDVLMQLARLEDGHYQRPDDFSVD